MESLWQDPVTYAIPLFLVMILTESYINWKENLHLYESKDTFASLTLGIGSIFVNLAVKSVAFVVYYWANQHALFPQIGWQWWAWLLLFFAEDFTFYVFHRSMHEVRLFWCAHSNHHSSPTLNFATALRQSWTELFWKYFFWLWLPFIGFEPMMIYIYMSLSLIWQYWPHTELIPKLPRWFEFIFNTPSHHRVHHASNIRYLDRNHAGVLIIWDRMFGTFSPEVEAEKPHYGITKNIDTIRGNPLQITIHEYRDLWHDLKRATTFKQRLQYLFLAPGWSHDGNDQRADTLRKQLSD
jgi:sterol desaturase/sphingolipid hydroxylase (fatty acid hydroxylase superfamily)